MLTPTRRWTRTPTFLTSRRSCWSSRCGTQKNCRSANPRVGVSVLGAGLEVRHFELGPVGVAKEDRQQGRTELGDLSGLRSHSDQAVPNLLELFLLFDR